MLRQTIAARRQTFCRGLSNADRWAARLVRRLGTSLAVCGLLVLSAGCRRGEELGRVTGKVSFKGQPVAKGQIVFANRAKGVHIVAPLQADGTYVVTMAKGQGLPLGDYEVYVAPLDTEAPTGTVRPAVLPDPAPDIPKKYRRPESSGQRLSVVSGVNRLDIDMNADG